MPITEKQRIKRKQSLGSSDLASIMGLNPWCAAHDTWMEKSGRLPEQEAGKAAKMGNYLEDALVRWSEDVLESGHLRRNCFRAIPDSCIRVNIDAMWEAKRIPIEAKTGGLLGGDISEWGDEGTDEVPKSTIIQCHAHMAALDADECYVPALLGRRGFVMFHVPRNMELQEHIIKYANDWWLKHIINDIEPDGLPSLPAIAQRIREPEKTIDITDPQFEADLNLLAEAKERLKVAKDQEAECKARVIKWLQDGEAATIEGELVVTYLETHRRGYEAKPTSYRQVRLK